MNYFSSLFLASVLFWATSVNLASAHSWVLVSPDGGQTFSYGSEQHSKWVKTGPNQILTLLLEYTNDPYVDRTNPRQYDRFSFHFPDVKLGQDGATFYFQPGKGHAIPVAEIKRDFLGVNEIHLTPYSRVLVELPHGLVTVRLVIYDRPLITHEAD